MSDLREQLRRHRTLVSSMTARTAPFRAAGEPKPIEALTTGFLHENELGASYVIPTQHEPDHQHGNRMLSNWLGAHLDGAAAFTRDSRLTGVDPRKFLFLDTETTGLYGAGAFAFLVGVGSFTEQGFEIRQYFLRDPGDEPAMLRELHDLSGEFGALVTFNGRSFDIPLLASRYIMNRQRTRLESLSNLDLLPPSRRIWKRRLESCRLANLELELLGVERTEADVPGFLIPQMYQDYVRTHDGREMTRVLYHNRVDILSMVTLAALVCETFVQPHQRQIPGEDLLSLARWYEQLGKLSDAEETYERALTAARRDADMVNILENLAALLKRQDRRAEAVQYWESWAALQARALEPRVELAKYYEWEVRNATLAVQWTEEALKTVRSWGYSEMRETTLAELEHRLERLKNKP